MKVAIPTKAYLGLEDTISEVFGKAKTFTIVELENNKIKNVQVIDNPGESYKYGSGPIAVKTLVDLKVDLVVAVELGPGASELLEHHHIKRILVEKDMKVADIVKRKLNYQE